MKKVLFVDDDPNILQGLRRMLRPLRDEWQLHFAGSAEEALEALRANPMDVVVTDMRMPRVDGVALLEQVRDHYPHIARIILSGQASQSGALRSVSAAHQFLAKPCEPDTLKSLVTRTCRLREVLHGEQLAAVATSIDRLPSVPEIYAELVAELENPDMSMVTLAGIVSRDVAMSAKVLQLVNSAFFGLPRHVRSIQEAITLLGTEVLRGLVLSNAAFGALAGAAGGLDLSNLSQHCLRVSGLARAIARAHGAPTAVTDHAMQAGLLHDLGQVLLYLADAGRYAEAQALASAEKLSLQAAERQVFGSDHAEMGAYLMGLWGLPDPVVEGIAFHHAPEREAIDAFAPVVAVHTANALVHQIDEGDTAGAATRLDDAVVERLGGTSALDELRSLAARRREEENS